MIIFQVPSGSILLATEADPTGVVKLKAELDRYLTPVKLLCAELVIINGAGLKPTVLTVLANITTVHPVALSKLLVVNLILSYEPAVANLITG